ncbi:MAG: transpeptidase family protein [Culturomica sp.]|jgi:cell division protein FtsI (penicillin-binding protein 3)|nr:transpeptidase family protein [Culturomica sp.]
MSMKREIIWRIGLIYLLVVGLAVAIVFQAFRVQVIEGKEWRNRSVEVLVEDSEVTPNRGDICAVDGRKLASSVPYYELRFDASVVDGRVFREQVDSLALCLSCFFQDASKAVYRKQLMQAREQKKRYFLINKKKINYIQLKQIRTFPIFRLGQNRGGLVEVMSSERIQPHENLANRTIGYLNREGGELAGLVGLEQAFESDLKGEPGRSVRQMMSGTWVPVTVEEPEDGKDVITTIDVDYQDIVQNALLRQLEKFEAEKGTAVLMEVKTGDIKAIANLTRKGDKYAEDKNYAVGDAVEPGSVIKAAAMIALLEDGFVEPEDTVDLGGSGIYTFYDRYLSESDDKKPGKISVQHLFEISSNGISTLVYSYYKEHPKRFVDRLCAMGLDKKLDVVIKGEGEPFVKHPGEKGWSGISLPWMSVGYELQLTPLQVLSFYNAIANDGQRMRPRFVKEIRSRGEVVERIRPEQTGARICSRATLKKIQAMLEGVVENGTARNIRTDHYRIAGKTGTARIATGTSGYDVRKYRASFVGYFPADKPLYSCIVMVDNPSLDKGYYASQVSGPVFREIADKVYSIAYMQYGEAVPKVEKTVPVCKNGWKKDFMTLFKALKQPVDGAEQTEQTNWVLTASNEGPNMVLKPRRINNSVVPNVKGMGLRDALYALENAGLRVEVSGSGMVQAQSLEPGTGLQDGEFIRIDLR